MRYGSTTLATNMRPPDWRGKLLKAVLFFIPAANPDIEPLYPKVRKWLLEVEDDGAPAREIALDAEGKVIFFAPRPGNLGFWIDSPMVFSEADLSAISAAEFEDWWQKAGAT